MAVASADRQLFEPDRADAVDAVATSPAIASSTALARFEFEPGRANDGTKILMVQWEDRDTDAAAGDAASTWEVSWEGKSTVLPARDVSDTAHRVYFLIGAGATIPPIVTISRRGGTAMHANPLPAIYPPELGATARTAGKKGVLHTIWAKQRLSVLEREIDTEMRENGEGVGLEMAMQEKTWIENNFGVTLHPDRRPTTDVPDPQSPRLMQAAGGSNRLAEKLKGLKLGTSPSDLSKRSHDLSVKSAESHPLSPDTGDVAVPFFSAFKAPLAAATAPRAVAQAPPQHIIAQQGRGTMAGSLNAVANGVAPSAGDVEPGDVDDELFAVKMSPRSPEMAKSPFSFASRDIAPWLKDAK